MQTHFIRVVYFRRAHRSGGRKKKRREEERGREKKRKKDNARCALRAFMCITQERKG